MYKKGSWKCVCDVCGFEFLSQQLKKRWDGLMVCRDDWETRHPQDFVRPVKESQVLWTRVELADVFIDVPYVGDGYAMEDYLSPNPDPIEGYYWL